MDDNQPQTNQKNDQPSKPIIVDNKTEAAKPANVSAVKPTDIAKTGTA